MHQGQTDALSPVGDNAVAEGSPAMENETTNTTVLSNITQILRKVVKVSDTANVTANYGRGRELQYQMEKKGKELKRDLEWAFLNNTVRGGTEFKGVSGNLKHVNYGTDVESSGGPLNEIEASGGGLTLPVNNAPAARRTAGFPALVAVLDEVDSDTGAVVNKSVPELTEDALFDITYNLYLAGSEANIIMFHPSQAAFFAGLQEKSDTRHRIFENTPKFSVYVSTVVDPLGQEYKLIPNRFMPEGSVYFFNPKDWTQMVLRTPQRTKLSKDGSYEKWMIEMEVGLRHRNPFASGMLSIAGEEPDTGDDVK